jgi:hypothetical protein
MLVIPGGKQAGAEQQLGLVEDTGHGGIERKPVGLLVLPLVGGEAAPGALEVVRLGHERPQRTTADVLAYYLLSVPDFAHIVASRVPGHYCATSARLRRSLI